MALGAFAARSEDHLSGGVAPVDNGRWRRGVFCEGDGEPAALRA